MLWNTSAAEWQVCVRWWDGNDQIVAFPTFGSGSEEGAHGLLVEAVNQAKVVGSGQRGGGFRINEFGQVVVPTGLGGASSARCVGQCLGSMTFEDPDGERFDLSDGGMEVGDVWTKPVVAFRYVVHDNNTISFEHHPDSTTSERIRLPGPRPEIANVARAIRHESGFAVFVNDRGVVLVKCPPDWEARYVGTVDLDTWFDEEVCP